MSRKRPSCAACNRTEWTVIAAWADISRPAWRVGPGIVANVIVASGLHLGQGWSLQGFNSMTDNRALNKRIFDVIDTSIALAKSVATKGTDRLLADIAAGATQAVTPQSAEAALEGQGIPGTDVSLKIVIVHYAARGVYPVLKPREFQERITDRAASFAVLDLFRLAPQWGSTFDAAALERAYRDAIDVWHGYKTKRLKGSRSRRIIRIPSVTFLVKKKAGAKRKPAPDQRIPKLLFAYWTVNGERQLVAVPTDVECATDYYAVRPQAPKPVFVTEVGAPGRDKGAIACKVRRRRPNSPDQDYAVSCRHLFARTGRRHPNVVPGSLVSDEGHTEVALTRSFVGELRDRGDEARPLLSFDAQLASVSDAAALEAVFNGLVINGHVANVDEVPASYFIHTPRRVFTANRRAFRRFDETPFLINYTHPVHGPRRVLHELLIESQVLGGETIKGDSGSPVVDAGGKLVGMHIAGGNRIAFMIPAWHLLDPRHFKGLGSNDTLTLL